MHPKEKACSVCKETKLLSEYRPQKAGKFGCTACCKTCESKFSAARYKKSAAINPERYWKKHLLANHNITPEIYYQYLAAQGGVCAICLKPPKRYGNKFRLSIDHDHACCPTITSCGKCIRGLVCHPCNVSLGLMKDDPTIFRRAALYLERTKK